MNRKGVISTINGNKVRVVFPELNDVVSYELKLAMHISYENLNIGDNVVVAFYNTDLKSGVIIAKVR